MSSPRKVRGKTGRDNDEEEGNSGNLNLRNSLPSSSQKMTPTKPIFGNKMNSENVKPSHHLSFSDKYELVYPEPLESDTDETVWDVSDLSLRNRWNSVDSETAGPSKTVSPVLSGSSRLSKDTETSVSEKELTQLAQIRPLIFNSSARSAMQDCLNTLQKKEELDIIREFLELEQMTLPDDFNSGNTLQNRDKNRYRDILPYRKEPMCKTLAVHQVARPWHSCLSRFFHKICPLCEEEPHYRTPPCSLQCWCRPNRGVHMCGCCVLCHREELLFRHYEHSDPDEKAALWHDSNQGAVPVLL